MREFDSICLNPADLADKFGFGDGDLGNDLMDLWLPTSVWSHFLDEDSYAFSPTAMYLDSRTLLVQLVDEWLVPTLPESLQELLTYMHTSHNPVRLDPRSSDLEPEAAMEQLIEDLASCDPINVSWDNVSDLCTLLHPMHPKGWLEMYAVLFYQPQVFMTLSPGNIEVSAWKRGHTGFALPPRVDELTKQWTDDELFLAADLLRSGKTITYFSFKSEDLNAALNTAHMVLK